MAKNAKTIRKRASEAARTIGGGARHMNWGTDDARVTIDADQAEEFIALRERRDSINKENTNDNG